MTRRMYQAHEKISWSSEVCIGFSLRLFCLSTHDMTVCECVANAYARVLKYQATFTSRSISTPHMCWVLVMTMPRNIQVCIGYEEYTRIETMTVPPSRITIHQGGDTQAIAQEVPSIFSDFDLYLWQVGNITRFAMKNGAIIHVPSSMVFQASTFAVWARNATYGLVIEISMAGLVVRNPMNLRQCKTWESGSVFLCLV